MVRFSRGWSASIAAISLVVFAAYTVGDGGVSLSVPPNAQIATGLQSWNESTPNVEVAKKSSALRVIVGGDLLPHRPMLSEPSQIATALAPLRSLFATADAVVANYETATGQISDAEDRRLIYGVEPAWMDAVAGSGVTAVTIANNHACDLGRVGLEASIRAAEGSMAALGAASDDPWRARTIAEKNGHRVCAVAWTTFTNNARSSCEKSGELALAPLDRKGIARAVSAIADARASGCDATIAIFHGGIEYEPQVYRVRNAAFAIAEAGADAVIIHHPHVPSPVHVAITSDGRHVPIFESIGNLVSNQGESWQENLPPTQADRRIVYLNGTTRAGLLAEMDFAFPPAGVSAGSNAHAEMSWGYHVVWNDNDHVSDKTNKTPLIEARLLSPTGDEKLVTSLSRDKALRALLRAPCWLEASAMKCR